MTPKEMTRISKFMALVLRHKPETIGLTLNKEGWVSVYEFITAMNTHGYHLNMVSLKQIIEADSKGRYSLDEKEHNIRANQGHSTEVELTFKEVSPPKELFHGTHKDAVDAIFKKGIMKMQRHHVHLSKDVSTAKMVGERRGSPVIFVVDAEQMSYDGFKFFISDNGVYLTDHVPSKYIKRY